MRFMIHLGGPTYHYYQVVGNNPLELMDELLDIEDIDKILIVKVDVSSESGAGIWVQVAHTHNSTSKRRTEKIDEKQRHDPEYIDQLVGVVWERALSARELYKPFRSASMEKFILEE